MELVHRITTVRERVRAWHREGLRVALVPTMGNLHRGHLSLVTAGLARADRLVASVFVNPLQFGPTEDFGRYPRTLERDCELLDGVGAQLLFAPAADEMYPRGVEQTAVVDVPGLADLLEGQFRPGHFAGVATVVTKLLNIVAADVAVFGEKDFQQLSVIERLVADLCLPVEVVAAPTVRDPDGLALSSRNQYLSPEERSLAPRLYAALCTAREQLMAGERDWAGVESAGLRALAGAGFAADYFAVRRQSDLLPPAADDDSLVVLAAARLGTTRLIDNLRVRLSP